MGERFYEASRAVLSPLFQTLWSIETQGHDNIPQTGPAILASNHLSYLDHFLMPAVVDRQVYFISKAEHFDVPVQSWLFEQWGVIPLARGEGDQEALERARQVIEEGDLFGIYPEGTRSLDGRLHKGHTGVARLALQTEAPIVPVGMLGTYQALPKGQRVPRFPDVEIRFGEPLRAPDGDPEDYPTLRKVTDDVMHAIQELTGQEYVDEYQWNPEYDPDDREGPPMEED